MTSLIQGKGLPEPYCWGAQFLETPVRQILDVFLQELLVKPQNAVAQAVLDIIQFELDRALDKIDHLRL